MQADTSIHHKNASIFLLTLHSLPGQKTTSIQTEHQSLFAPPPPGDVFSIYHS